MALALLLAISNGAPLIANGAPAGAAPTSGLQVVSDPAGASVYVDGRFAGQTPLNLSSLAAGDHRVRVTKDGYLENARVVSVQPGRAKGVDIKLTRNTQAAAAAQVTGGGGQGGGGGILSNKWLWIGVAGAGGGAAAYYFLTKNAPPVAGTINVSPAGTGMAGQTSFSFSAPGANDPDGDPLEFTWNFGDGGTATGNTATRTYATAGTFSVTLSVSDGKKSASSPAASVTVGPNIAGAWTGGRDGIFGCGVNVTLAQATGNLTGSMTLAGTCTGTLPGVTGTVSPLTHPATVTWQSPPFVFTATNPPGSFANLVMSFTGTTNAAGTSMTGTLRLRQTSSTADVSVPATYTR